MNQTSASLIALLVTACVVPEDDPEWDIDRAAEDEDDPEWDIEHDAAEADDPLDGDAVDEDDPEWAVEAEAIEDEDRLERDIEHQFADETLPERVAGHGTEDEELPDWDITEDEELPDWVTTHDELNEGLPDWDIAHALDASQDAGPDEDPSDLAVPSDPADSADSAVDPPPFNTLSRRPSDPVPAMPRVKNLTYLKSELESGDVELVRCAPDSPDSPDP